MLAAGASWKGVGGGGGEARENLHRDFSPSPCTVVLFADACSGQTSGCWGYVNRPRGCRSLHTHTHTHTSLKS